MQSKTFLRHGITSESGESDSFIEKFDLSPVITITPASPIDLGRSVTSLELNSKRPADVSEVEKNQNEVQSFRKLDVRKLSVLTLEIFDE